MDKYLMSFEILNKHINENSKKLGQPEIACSSGS